MELVRNYVVFVWLIPLLSQIVLPLIMTSIYCICYCGVVLFEMGSGYQIRNAKKVG